MGVQEGQIHTSAIHICLDLKTFKYPLKEAENLKGKLLLCFCDNMTNGDNNLLNLSMHCTRMLQLAATKQAAMCNL